MEITLEAIISFIGLFVGGGAGAFCDDKKNNGAGGMSGKMSPSAVIVIRPDGTTKLVNVKNQDSVTKILDMVPDLVDKFTKKKEDEVSDEDAASIAFPEEAE